MEGIWRPIGMRNVKEKKTERIPEYDVEDRSER